MDIESMLVENAVKENACNASPLAILATVRKLIDKKIADMVLSMNQDYLLNNDAWYKNTKTKRLAKYFCRLGYRIEKCSGKENISESDRTLNLLANQIFSARNIIVKFDDKRLDFIKCIKQLANAKTDVVLELDGLDGREKGTVIQLCDKFQKLGWISSERANTAIKINVLDKNKQEAKSFWNGGWAERVNRNLTIASLNEFTNQKKLKSDVFTNVQLVRIGKETDNPDMQLDVVAVINKDRLYIFETKTGKNLGVDKWVDRARMFSLDGKSRFVTCCSDDSVPTELFRPYFLVPLSKLKEQLSKWLNSDFNENA